MDYTWINTTWVAVAMVVLSTIGIYISLICFTRIAGLRSFSKMSSFDFAITVAIGSLIASTILAKDPPLLLAIVALGILFVVQMVVASLRGSSTIMSKLVDNQPLLLMDNERMLEENLKKAKVTHADLRAKLREANVTQMSQIKAVVMEATGDISVLHHQDEEHELDPILLKEVH
jgi:uncharacterized membrane protein YcaP (DUF421 family)